MITTQITEGQKRWYQERMVGHVTQRLREIMLEKRITVQTLAETLGKSVDYTSNMLEGKTNITLRTLADLYLALGHQLELPGDQSEPTAWAVESYAGPQKWEVFNSEVAAEMYVNEYLRYEGQQPHRAIPLYRREPAGVS